MQVRARGVVEEVEDLLHERGWGRPPRGACARLASLVGDEPVLHRDALVLVDRDGGHEARVVLFTTRRLFVQTLRCRAGEERVGSEVVILRRSALRSLVPASRARGGRGLGGWLDRAHRRPLEEPWEEAVLADYDGLRSPLRLPLEDGWGEDADRELLEFLPVLATDLS